jgi:ribosome recycling factor
MAQTVRLLKEQLSGVRAGALSVGLLATFRVQRAGASARLDRLGTLRPQGDRIVVTPFDQGDVGGIVKALVEAHWNAYALDPRSIAVSVPTMSGEQRVEIARQVKKLGEEAKVAVRMVRQDTRKQIASTGRGSERRVQEATDEAIAEIERLVTAKLAELSG